MTLEADGKATVVRLRHHGLPEPSIEAHDDGWRRYLPELAKAATTEGGDR